MKTKLETAMEMFSAAISDEVWRAVKQTQEEKERACMPASESIRRFVSAAGGYPGHLCTDWYPSTTLPVRHGWYEVRHYDGYSVHLVYYMDGSWFTNDSSDIVYAEVGDDFEWRGLRAPT